MTPLLIVILLLYTAAVVSTVYFCVIADPNKNRAARYVSITLPRFVWKRLSKLLGPKALRALESVGNRLLVVIYCAVVFGSWSIIFNYVYPWVDEQQNRVRGFHKYVGYFVFSACVISWSMAMTSCPGIITKSNARLYDHYPYDNLMFVSDRICKTTGAPRLARSKYDRFKYKQNVPRFDHFCGWVYNTIGEENYRYFLLFLVVHLGMCSYGTAILSHLFYGEILDKQLFEVTFFNRDTGEELKPDRWIIFQYLVGRHTYEAGVLLLMGVMSLALGAFLGYHVWLTSRGLTTNEAYKWSDVQKWYKTELRRYKEAVRNGTIDPNNKNNTTSTTTSSASASSKQQRGPVVGDGDVTCTPTPGAAAAAAGSSSSPSSSPKDDETTTDDNGSTTSGAAAAAAGSGDSSRKNVVQIPTKLEELDDDAVFDPGPPPVNIYDRGFVENWKEVLFPISIRKRRELTNNSTINKPKAT